MLLPWGRPEISFSQKVAHFKKDNTIPLIDVVAKYEGEEGCAIEICVNQGPSFQRRAWI
jgi:hypothetical protein